MTQDQPEVQGPWRDGTIEGEVSADLFDKVVASVMRDAPQSTRFIADTNAIDYIKRTVDVTQLQISHLDYLFDALDDETVLDLIDALAARVRLVAGRVREPVAA